MMDTEKSSQKDAGTHSLPFPPLHREVSLLLLAWVAGSTDALSYLGLGHIFTANMTGNTVLLGIALGQGHLTDVVRSLLALLGFSLGVALGAMIVGRDRSQMDWPFTVTSVLAIESVVLIAFSSIWYITGTARHASIEDVLILLSALAMGMQSIAVLRLGISGITTTYITGTWTTFIANLVSQIMPGHYVTDLSNRNKQHNLLLQLAVLLTYGIAAAISGLEQVHWIQIEPLLPLLALLIVVINATIHHQFHAQ